MKLIDFLKKGPEWIYQNFTPKNRQKKRKKRDFLPKKQKKVNNFYEFLRKISSKLVDKWAQNEGLKKAKTQKKSKKCLKNKNGQKKGCFFKIFVTREKWKFFCTRGKKWPKNGILRQKYKKRVFFDEKVKKNFIEAGW